VNVISDPTQRNELDVETELFAAEKKVCNRVIEAAAAAAAAGESVPTRLQQSNMAGCAVQTTWGTRVSPPGDLLRSHRAEENIMQVIKTWMA
ncbi:hypothetical protein JYU34_020781, partial [Plutella xylostella]